MFRVSIRRLARTAGWLSLCFVSIVSARPAVAQKVLAPGFETELLFEVPDVEHPSVVACDEAGNLFIGEDPMDMRGPTTKEFDRVLFVRWNDDGTSTRTVFCENLSAVFGLVWLDGWLYVMHAPHYSRFADTDGDGVADVREDLAEGFGPPAGVFGFNDHIVTGTRLGMDGWMYVSVGDKGIQKATGKDGSTITLEGGGVVRMRPDGTQLQVYSNGTRNHLDVAMNSLDEIFTYDNTDDGLGWWTRFTHHIETGYYGYPYDYLQRAERHLPRISEHGGGSPCGADCYREAVWPAQYRETPFFAEWGKGKVQCFHLQKSGGSYTAEIEDFMVPEENSTFRPVDLCFSPDGKHMYVADWNFSGWTNPTVCGRVYRVTYVGTPDKAKQEPCGECDDSLTGRIAELANPSFSVRTRAQRRLAQDGESVAALRDALEQGKLDRVARIHAVWALRSAQKCVEDYDAVPELTKLLADENADVRAQAVRALAECATAEDAETIVALLDDAEPRVRVQAAIALGQLGSAADVAPLIETLDDADVTARFARIQALRRLCDWSAASQALESAASAEILRWGLVAAIEQYDMAAVELLARRLKNSSDADERRKCVEALAAIYYQAAPYEKGWWGTRPAAQAPPRPKTKEWEGSPAVVAALTEHFQDQEDAVRAAVVRAFQTVPCQDVLPALRELADTDASDQVRQAAFTTLAKAGDAESIAVLLKAAESADSSDELQAAAVRAVVTLGAAGQAEEVRKVLGELSDSSTATIEVALLALDGLASLASPETISIVEGRTHAERAEIRAKALTVLTELKKEEAITRLEEALSDEAPLVRQTAARQLGELGARTAVPELVRAINDPEVRFEATLALAKIADPAALDVYLDAVTDKSPEIREAARQTLVTLRGSIAESVLARAARGELTHRARGVLAEVYMLPRAMTDWHLIGPWSKESGEPAFDPAVPAALDAPLEIGDQEVAWKTAVVDAASGKVDVTATLGDRSSAWALGFTLWETSRTGKHTFQVGSDDQLKVWIDGQQVFEFGGERGWSPAQQSFEIDLAAGAHPIWIQCGNGGAQWEFSVHVPGREERFEVLASADDGKPDIGPYIEHAMQHDGDVARGQQLFQDLKGLACAKCHAIGGDAKALLAGPDLAGIGAKYDRRELIRSVLEPSNRLLSGYELTIVATADGEVLQGVVKSDTAEQLELVDINGKVIRLTPDDIEERTRSELSLMPTGLFEGITVDEFADLLAYLQSLREVKAVDSRP